MSITPNKNSISFQVEIMSAINPNNHVIALFSRPRQRLLILPVQTKGRSEEETKGKDTLVLDTLVPVLIGDYPIKTG